MPGLEQSQAAAIRRVAERHSGVALLIVFGSHSRGDYRRSSDWDFGYIARDALDSLGLRADLARVLGSDAIDLVDLERAGGLLRYRAARDGKVVFERSPGSFARFWLDAVGFWCDAAPILEHGYEGILNRLAP